MSFPKILTNGGGWDIIYTTHGGGEQPIHGAYYTGEEWIVTAWTKEGFRNPSQTSSTLDISKAVRNGDVLPQKEEREAS